MKPIIIAGILLALLSFSSAAMAETESQSANYNGRHFGKGNRKRLWVFGHKHRHHTKEGRKADGRSEHHDQHGQAYHRNRIKSR